MSTDKTEPTSKVAAAIAEVMAGVKMLGKGSENQHGRYKFAGIDDFLEATRPLCAKAGLIIIQDEEDFQTIDNKWLAIRFGFTLAHASGEVWPHVVHRTIMVQSAMGAQAFGAAQSYSLKQFMRSLFQMATGDKEDADFHEQSALPGVKDRLNKRTAVPTEGFNTATADHPWADRFQRELAEMTSKDMVKEAWEHPTTKEQFEALKQENLTLAKALHAYVSQRMKELA